MHKTHTPARLLRKLALSVLLALPLIPGAASASEQDDYWLSQMNAYSPYFLANVLRPTTDANFRTSLYERMYNHCPACRGNGLWLEGDYGQAKWDADKYSLDEFKVKSGGVKFGAEHYFENAGFVAGFYGAYTSKSMKQDENKADVDSIGGGVYGGWIKEKWEIKALLGAAYDKYDVKRKIKFYGEYMQEYAKDDFHGYTLNADLEAAYKIRLNETWLLRPYIGVDGAMTDYESFSDKDYDVFNVKGDRLFISTARAGLGVRGKRAKLGWTARAEYNYLLTGRYPEIDLNLNYTDMSFKSRGAEPGRSALGLYAGLNYDLTPRLNAYVNGAFQTADGYKNLHGSLGLRYVFCGKAKSKAAAVAPVAAAAVAAPALPKHKITAYYEFDHSDLTPKAKQTLEQAAQEINQTQNAQVNAVGHTDSVGSDQYNQALSERRARSAAQYLRGKGVKNVKTRGKGESEPVADNSTAKGRAQNRRVEIWVE